MTRNLQTRVNKLLPEKLHQVLTATIKQMVRAVLFGSGVVGAAPRKEGSLELREALILEKIKSYRKTAAIEGGITGFGGLWWGMADFPLLLGLKLKLLFDIAGYYGFDASDYKERIYLLNIFQLAFSSQEHRNIVFQRMDNWKQQAESLPGDINQFDWRSFQQEYRDHIDLAKMAQLIPLVGAPVGLIVNYRLVKKLGETAMFAYRMRWF